MVTGKASSRLVMLDGRFADFAQAFSADYDVVVSTLDKVAELGARRSEVAALVTAGDRPVLGAADQLPNLGLVALIGSGFEGIEVAPLRARGVEVTNAAGANAEDVATHAVALLLGLNRSLVEDDARVRAGLWRSGGRLGQMRSMGSLKVGVAGLGAIGLAIVKRLQPFGCELAWWGPRPKPEAPLPRLPSLEALAAWSDVLVLALRADASNTGLVDGAILRALGPQGMLVNISRGSVVDEAQLMAALRVGELGGAALDVFAQEPVTDTRWRDTPNTLLTPHCAGAGDAARRQMIAMVRENLDRFLSGRPLASPVPG
ncbi:MAG: 2-hydroxyacid dehydrogenase [Phenylobacterium sp.]|nr:2-hydroxyacid dehydrogenase [Phenylobacterium sp.]